MIPKVSTFLYKKYKIFEGKRSRRKHGKESKRKYNSETGKIARYESIPSPFTLPYGEQIGFTSSHPDLYSKGGPV
jgi:hypothetical protein